MPFTLALRSPTFALKSSCVSAPASFIRPSICIGPLAMTGTSSFLSMLPISGCSILSVRSAPSSGSSLPTTPLMSIASLPSDTCMCHAHVAADNSDFSGPASPFNDMG